MPLDVQEAMMKGRLLQATRRHKDIAKLDMIGADEEGESWPLWCDVNSLGELGPGVPLYFHFVKHVASRLVASGCLYMLVAVYYWRSSTVKLNEFGQRPRPVLNEQVLGASMDEWALGLYVGCSMRGMNRLWSTHVRKKSIYMPRVSWLTAASRGPWRGDYRRSCRGLSLAVDAGGDSPERNLSGVYTACGYHHGLPWFQSGAGGTVLYAARDVKYGRDVWQVASYSGHAAPCQSRGLESTLDASSIGHPPLAQSLAHEDQFPHFVQWPGLNISLGHKDVWVTGSRCPTRHPGIQRILCYDVALLCAGCEQSLLGRKLPKDTDILLVSCASVLLFWLSWPCFKAKGKTHENDSRERTFSADDYAIYVRRLPSSKLHNLDEVEIASFFERCLDARYAQQKQRWQRSVHHVVRVTFTFRLGRIFLFLNKERDTSERLRRLHQIMADLKRELSLLEGCCGRSSSLFRRLRLQYLHFSLWLLKGEQQRAKSRLVKCSQALASAYESLRVAGAIVTFEHPLAARRALEVFNSSTIHLRLLGDMTWFSVPRRLRRLVLRLPPSGLLRRLFWQEQKGLEFQNCMLSVERPPEPSDIVWQYLGEPGWMLFCFRFLGISILLACLAGLTFATYALRKFATHAKRERDDGQRRWKTWMDMGISIAPAAGVVWADILMRELICKGVVMEHHNSWTRTAAAAMWKLTLAAIANSALVMLLVHTVVDDVGITCEKNWYLQGNLLDDATSMSAIMMVSTPIIQMIPIWNLANLIKQRSLCLPGGIGHLFCDPASSRMTQEELNELFSGAEYRIGYRYATIFRMLFVTLLYAPLTPIVVPMGLLGLFLQYWADKICLVRLARRPPWQTLKLLRLARKMLPLILIPIPLFTLFLLRGTAFSHAWEWLKPCIHPASLIAHRHGKESQSARTFVMYACIVMPCCVALPTTFGRGGYTCCRRLLSVPRMLWGRARGSRRGSRDPEPVLNNDDSFHQSASSVSDAVHDEQELNYYSAQGFLPAMYHKCNPVYRALPEVLNPELILQPEPTAQDQFTAARSESSWERLQLRKEQQRKRVDELWERSLRPEQRRLRSHFRSTIGGNEKDAIPLQVALEKIIHGTATVMKGWHESGEEAPEFGHVPTVGHMNLLCEALRQHQKEETDMLFGKGESMPRRASLELAKSRWRAGGSLMTSLTSGGTAARRRWMLVQHAFFTSRLDRGSSVRRTQSDLSAPLTQEIEMASCRDNSKHGSAAAQTDLEW